MAKEVKLGSIVQDRITGFKGMAIGKHTYLTGCDKITVQPQEPDKDGGLRKAEWFDVTTLTVLKEPKPGLVDSEGPETKPGGPSEMPQRSMR